jgi:hypothetical protein
LTRPFRVVEDCVNSSIVDHGLVPDGREPTTQPLRDWLEHLLGQIGGSRRVAGKKALVKQLIIRRAQSALICPLPCEYLSRPHFRRRLAGPSFATTIIASA